MKVEIRLTQDAYEPYAVIYTNEITDEARETADSIHASNRIVIANEDERSIVLSARDIYMISIEDAAVWIHCKEDVYKRQPIKCGNFVFSQIRIKLFPSYVITRSNVFK